MNDDDDYEHVYVIRWCSIETFYASSFRHWDKSQKGMRTENKMRKLWTDRRERRYYSSRRSWRRGWRVFDMSRREFRSHRQMRTRFLPRMLPPMVTPSARARYVENDYRRQTTLVRLVGVLRRVGTEVPLCFLFTRRGNRRRTSRRRGRRRRHDENFQICSGNEASLEWLKHRLSTFDIVANKTLASIGKWSEDSFRWDIVRIILVTHNTY